MTDPFAELDDLLGEIDKQKKKNEPAQAPATSNNSSNNKGGNGTVWKQELDDLLGEISNLEVKMNNQPKSQPSNTNNSSTASRNSVNYKATTSPQTSSPAVTGEKININGKLELSVEETKLAKELSRARSHPREYAAFLQVDRRPYFDGKLLKLPNSNVSLSTEEGVSAVDEAIKFLQTVDPLPEFTVSLGMTQAAKEAVSEVGGKGEFVASKSIGKLDNYGRFEVEAVELVSFGNADAREIVLRFLVGDGNPERVHRSHIFNAGYKAIGVGVGPHSSNYKVMAIVNFSNNFIEKQ